VDEALAEAATNVKYEYLRIIKWQRFVAKHPDFDCHAADPGRSLVMLKIRAWRRASAVYDYSYIDFGNWRGVSAAAARPRFIFGCAVVLLSRQERKSQS